MWGSHGEWVYALYDAALTCQPTGHEAPLLAHAGLHARAAARCLRGRAPVAQGGPPPGTTAASRASMRSHVVTPACHGASTGLAQECATCQGGQPVNTGARREEEDTPIFAPGEVRG